MRSKISIEFWVISVLFILGFLVRTYHLGAASLDDDEIKTTLRINHSLLDTIALLRHSSFPPLHYIILNLWVAVFGNGEWALRFPSAFFSSLTVIVIFKLGAELFSNAVGLIAALLLVFSPFALNYAQDAKMYALFWFLAAGTFLFFFRFLKDRNEGSYRSYIMTSVLCCYTMYTGFLFVAAQNLIFLLMGKKTDLRKWFKGQLIIISSCIPWLIWVLCSKREVLPLRSPGAEVNYLTYFLKSFYYIIGSAYGRFGDINCFLYVFLITFCLVSVGTISYKNKMNGLGLLKNYYYLLIWIAVPLFIYLIFDCFFVRTKLPFRYIGFLQVPIILIVSSQINNFHHEIKKILLVVMVFIAMSSAYFYFTDNLRFPGEDWRLTAKELTHDLGKKDIVLSFISVPLFQYYYEGDTRRFFAIPEEIDPALSIVKEGIPIHNAESVFILYQKRSAPDIKLNGFSLDYRVSNGGIGFLHFKHDP